MVQTTAIDLHGRRAFVSGGTKGAGAAIARRLEAAGATVLVTARSQPRDLDPDLFIAADLTSAEGVATAVAEALDRLGGVDVLVNNLGGSAAPAGGFAALSENDWHQELNTNLLAAVRLDRGLLPSMMRRAVAPSCTSLPSRRGCRCGTAPSPTPPPRRRSPPT